MSSQIKSEGHGTDSKWSKYAKFYDPIKCASIDGTDEIPHDRAVEKAIKSTYKPNRFVKGQPGCTIFVSRLSYSTTKDSIKELFSKYGKLKRFRMVKDIVTGMPKGYAFVEYEEEKDAETAYRMANRMKLDGTNIFVDFECERLLKGWKPRRLGGGFGGKKESGQLRFGGRDRPFRKPIAMELEDKRRREKLRHSREDTKRHRERSRERHDTGMKRLASRSRDDDDHYHKRQKAKTPPPSTPKKQSDSATSSLRSIHSNKQQSSTKPSPDTRSRSPSIKLATKRNSIERARHHHATEIDHSKHRQRDSPSMENKYYITDHYSSSSTPRPEREDETASYGSYESRNNKNIAVVNHERSPSHKKLNENSSSSSNNKHSPTRSDKSATVSRRIDGNTSVQNSTVPTSKDGTRHYTESSENKKRSRSPKRSHGNRSYFERRENGSSSKQNYKRSPSSRDDNYRKVRHHKDYSRGSNRRY